jgi:hypothetical protein
MEISKEHDENEGWVCRCGEEKGIIELNFYEAERKKKPDTRRNVWASA